jgi:hypothetical protein
MSSTSNFWVVEIQQIAVPCLDFSMLPLHAGINTHFTTTKCWEKKTNDGSLVGKPNQSHMGMGQNLVPLLFTSK